MALRGDVVVLGVGARIATGLDALGSAMSVRARKSFVRETRFVDRAGAPIALATLSSIGEDVEGRDRFVELAAKALAESAQPWIARFAGRGHPVPPLALLLALPVETDPLDARGVRLFAALAEKSGVPIDVVRSRVFALGRAAGAYAIEQAAARLARNEDEAILVGGVDSWFDAERLELLDRACRLHSAETENGFIPGEGAAFLLLGARRRSGSEGISASVIGVGTEREPRPFGSREPCHALGITLAVKRAIEPAGGAKIDWALTDLVGERHRIDEWLFASGRIQSSFTPDIRHDTPLLLTGDLGAATVAFLCVLACIGWRTGASPPGLALVAAHSDEAERGALLLAAEAS